MRRFSAICLALLCCLGAFAQQPEVSQRWLMNERLLDLVSNYENYSAFNKRSDRYAFLAMFQSSDAPVYCDYLASRSFGTSIKAADYAVHSLEMEDRTVRISRVKKGPYKYQDGKWTVELEFDKMVDYEDSLGFVFTTTSPMVGGDFHIVMSCVWNPESESFQIQSVKGHENSASSFPKGDFRIVQRKNEIDDRMLYGGKPLRFNEYGFAILPYGQEFEVDDDDFALTVSNVPGAGRYVVNSFSIVPKRFRVRGYVSGSPFGAYKVTTTTDADIKSSSFAVEFGGNIGYALPLGRTTKLVFYSGLGFNISGLSLSAENVSYSLAVADSERNPITRTYNLQSVTEGLTLTDIVIPAFLSLEQSFSSKLAVVADLGAKVYLSTSASPKPYHIQGVVNGQNIDKDFDQFVSPNQNKLNQFSVSLVGKAGVDYAFNKGQYVFFHLGYELGLTDSYAPVTPVKWYGTEGIYPLVYTGTEDVAVHSFLTSVSYKRSGFVMELGVRFKFGKKE